MGKKNGDANRFGAMPCGNTPGGKTPAGMVGSTPTAPTLPKPLTWPGMPITRGGAKAPMLKCPVLSCGTLLEAGIDGAPAMKGEPLAFKPKVAFGMPMPM